MYAKLIFRNVRRSVRDYLIYIVTITLCVALFYGFLSISSRYYQPELGAEYDLTLLSDGMKMAICAVAFFLLFLIHYVNNYMIRRRQKEFAIQTIMGMEQSTTAKMFFAETFVMGLVSIGIGILLGMAGSQFVTAMLLSSYGKSFRLSWMLFPDTVLLTAVFFTVTFLAVGLWNIRTIKKIKIIHMLNAEKTNEGDFRKGKWLPVITLIYGIFLVGMLVIGIIKMNYYFDSRYPLPVHVLFWGNILVPAAALLYLVLWGIRRKTWRFRRLLAGWLLLSISAAAFAALTPSTCQKYYLPLGAEAINQYLLFLLADVIFFICSFIYLINDGICLIKEKSPKHRYHAENLFFYGQISTKLRTTTKTTSLICLTLVLSICLFMAVPALIGWASGYLEKRSVYDVQISSQYNNVYEETELFAGDYELVTSFLNANHIETAYDCTFNLYLPRKADFHQRIKYAFPVTAISLTDYNALLTMCGYAPITLKENEFTTQWRSLATEDDRRTFLSSSSTLMTDMGVLALAAESEHHYDLGGTLYNTYTDVVYVLPDSTCQDLLAVGRNRYIQTTEPLPFQTAVELEKLFGTEYSEGGEGMRYYIRIRTQQVNSSKASSFILQTSMTYGAIVLLVICFTILSLQQLADAVHYRYRFGVLRKMGVEESHINRLILKQLAVWFGLPVSIAALISLVLTTYFFQMISVQISVYIGISTLLLQVGVTVIILIGLLICYFISTWILLKRSIC